MSFSVGASSVAVLNLLFAQYIITNTATMRIPNSMNMVICAFFDLFFLFFVMFSFLVCSIVFGCLVVFLVSFSVLLSFRYLGFLLLLFLSLFLSRISFLLVSACRSSLFLSCSVCCILPWRTVGISLLLFLL